MVRLTEKRNGKNVVKSGYMALIFNNKTGNRFEGEAIDKLAAYEDAEEQGLLLRLPCNEVWFICDKGTEYATIMSKDIDDLTGCEVRKIDRDGRYWSTKEKAEAKLAEMEGAE